MSYRVVFDITESGYDPSFALFGLVFVVIGAALWFGSSRGFPSGVRPAKVTVARLFAGVFFGFSLLWTGTALFSTYSSFMKARAAMNDGRAQVVEGPITEFRPSAAKHPRDRFKVQGVPFKVDSSVVTPGFRQTSSEGSPLRDGLKVRIHYMDHDILRLEVDAEASRSSPPPPLASRLVFLFPLIFLPIGLIVPFMLSRLSGWSSLAQRFASTELRGDETFTMQSIRMSSIGSYNNCINVAVGPDVISLAVAFPFGVFHKPLVIPMSEILSCEPRKVFWRKVTLMTLAGEETRIQFFGSAGAAILRSWEKFSGSAPSV